MDFQRTIGESISAEGVGLHSGQKVRVKLHPAPAHYGLCFWRSDIAGAEPFSLSPENVIDVRHATTIGKGESRVRTVEHLLSALHGLGVDNLLVEVEGEELPAMDGSAYAFVLLLERAGLVNHKEAKEYYRVKAPIKIDLGHRRVEVFPSNAFSISYTMDFNHPYLDREEASFVISPALYKTEIAKARTYGFLKDLAMLRAHGLALGGTLENALLIGDQGVLNGGYRLPDELVRHKLLDLIGDLYVLGKPLLGHVEAYCSGHDLNYQLVDEIYYQLHDKPREAKLLAGTPADALKKPAGGFSVSTTTH